MAPQIIVVKAALDPDAGVWFIESSDIPGLNLEAPTIEELRDKIPGAVLDLLAEGDLEGDDTGREVPIEIIAHASTRVRVRDAA